ncbi:MAG: CDP-diacylglycerol diphosphatase [Elusimicrobia bacterium]|nr:CDP-diacylglycerol diphosphatase [Elusimicrobiota bacterium]
MRLRRASLAALFLVLGGCARAETLKTEARPKRSILFTIVDQCLDSSRPGYCDRTFCPAPLVGTCPWATACKQTNRLIRQDAEFAAIRDIKSCEPTCPSRYLHALVIPKAFVSGVEDPNRPRDSWRFAWETLASLTDEQGRTLVVGEESRDVAFVINPPFARSQHQFHIHIVRLAPGGRDLLMRRRPEPERVSDLRDVWTAAQANASKAQLPGAADFRFGVIVFPESDQTAFRVVAFADKAGSEATDYACPKSEPETK